MAHLHVRHPSGRFAVQIVCPDDLSKSGAGSPAWRSQRLGFDPPLRCPEPSLRGAGAIGGGIAGSPTDERIRFSGSGSVTKAISRIALPHSGHSKGKDS
ncbi:MAG: hypothetical protein ACRERS_08625 [Methylococcales bacterium]